MFSKPASAEAIISLMARVGGNREVETAEAARHGHAIEASLAGGFQVLVGLACVTHAAVFAVGAFGVHLTRLFGLRLTLANTTR